MRLTEDRMKEIEKQTENLFKEIEYDYNIQQEIDVIHIAQQLGFQVGSAVLNENDDGFIIVQDGQEEILGIKTDKLIGVNASRELKWKRFIIAHELAHYILHYDRQKNIGIYAHRDHKKGKDKIENEADYFAANILMPKDKFKREYDELKDVSLTQKILKLSEKFVVTERTIQRRIEELGLD